MEIIEEILMLVVLILEMCFIIYISIDLFITRKKRKEINKKINDEIEEMIRLQNEYNTKQIKELEKKSKKKVEEK